MMLGFRTIRARRRLIAARAAYLAAKRAYEAADIRQDTRRMHEATVPLQAAHREYLAAEIALADAMSARLQPLPRHQGTLTHG